MNHRRWRPWAALLFGFWAAACGGIAGATPTETATATPAASSPPAGSVDGDAPAASDGGMLLGSRRQRVGATDVGTPTCVVVESGNLVDQCAGPALLRCHRRIDCWELCPRTADGYDAESCSYGSYDAGANLSCDYGTRPCGVGP
jgi:hypothetical protein